MDETFKDRLQAVELARERPFRLGSIEVRPATREVVGAGGREILEPRVMQVLVALARADGEIVTRDDLTASCWDGRVVGEDAISRVLSRLRRLSEGLAEGSWALETITKVGYRLRTGDEVRHAPLEPTSPTVAAPLAAGRRLPARRALLAGGAAGVIAAAAGAVWLVRRQGGDSQPPADIADLIGQAELAIRQANTVDDSIAIGLMRQVTERHPDYAPGWGVLAADYAYASHYASGAQAPGMLLRALEMANRALAIDPKQLDAQLALAVRLPRLGNWLAVEKACRAVLGKKPKQYLALITLALTLGLVGRCRERAQLLDTAAGTGPPTPGLLFTHIVALWAAGRLEDADRAAQHGMDIAPRHFAVWFSKLYLLLFTGRAQQALGMVDDVDNRPGSIGPAEFENVRKVISAVNSRDRQEVAAAIELCLQQARNGSGHAENSIQFTCALGDVDSAFAVAEAYYFDRGFAVADTRFDPQQSRFTRKDDRSTAILFLPSTAPMRSDRRFQPLVEELGLERYWRESGSRPDYRA